MKKHTALTVSRKDVDTSFIFFPVRLETRFVADYPVEDVSEPDKVLYAFKALWHYVEAIRHGNSPTVLLSRATTLMERVEGLDTVYREDRTRLKDLAAAVVKATEPTGELAKVWDRIRIHIPRLATLDVVSDNEATEFLRKLDRVDRTIRRMVDRPEYSPLLQKDCGLCGKMWAMDIVEEKLASYGEMRLDGHNRTDWAFDHDFDELENFLAGQEA